MTPDEPSDTRRQEIADLALRVYEIHDWIIRETGGLTGLRDVTLLHSAVARPFATFGGEDLYPDDFDKAAALFHSLIKNHPFLDGYEAHCIRCDTLFSGGICNYPESFVHLAQITGTRI